MKYRLSDNLELSVQDNKKEIRCLKCKHVIISADEGHWKEKVTVKESPPSKLGPLYPDTGRFILREYYCPKCLALFDVEMVLKEDLPIKDIVYG